MTREQKDLLLKDLSARLPYEVKIAMPGLWDRKITIEPLNVIFKGDDDLFRINGNGHCIEYVKPYLFPLSSMTDEQKEEFDQIFELELKAISDEIDPIRATEFEVDFYNKHHLDWRGLIPMGLAIDATGLNIY